jgi:hypothetical protein
VLSGGHVVGRGASVVWSWHVMGMRRLEAIADGVGMRGGGGDGGNGMTEPVAQ